jgi:DNA polymerase-3 subunit alpha
MIAQWLEKNRMDAKFLLQDSAQVFVIGDMTFLYLEPKDGKIFNHNFELILSEEEYQILDLELGTNYFAFQFGEEFWYSEIGAEKPQLKPLKYIGRVSGDDGFPYLGIHGGYELCSGSRDYADWCKKAKFLGIETLGLTERHTLAGAIKFQEACQKSKIKAVIGETITIKDQNNFRAKLYVADYTGWRNLLRIHKKLNVDNHSTAVDLDFVIKHSEGLYMVIQNDTMMTDELADCLVMYSSFKRIFFQFDPVIFKNKQRDLQCLNCLKEALNRLDQFQLALICDSYYLEPGDARVKQILSFIGKAEPGYQTNDQYFKSYNDVALECLEMFESAGDEFAQMVLEAALEGASEIAKGCDFNVKTGEIHLPKYEFLPEEEHFNTSEALFYHLIGEGMESKIPQEDHERYWERVKTEADVIERGGFVDYFLILRDIINWCEANDIMVGTGRGSVGGSIIAYLLGITKVDAIRYGLIFERFLNEGRIGKGLPDIDTDFESARREDVKRYIETRYGKHNVCSIGTYNALKLKGAFRDILRVHAETPQTINYFGAIISESGTELEQLFIEGSQSDKLKQYIDEKYAAINDIPLVLGQPKSASIHAAGIIITPKELKGEPMQIYDWFPVKLMDGLLVSEWEGPQLDACGYLKADILGLTELDKLKGILKLIEAREGEKLDLQQIDLADESVFDLFRQGLNQDVFQFGTDGLSAFCREVKPDSVDELAAINALYRPGPMDSGAHNDYVKIKFGKKEPEYDFGTEEISQDTYSLLIYQEQVMNVCVQLGGFTPTVADDIRKAMGKKIPEKLKSYQEKFVAGAVERGCPEHEAHKIWNKLVAFAGYGFNKSHAVAYSLIGYQSQWLKAHYPLEFFTISLQFAKDEEIAKRISEINRFEGIKIAPPEINKSGEKFFTDWESGTIYWSLSKITQIGEVALKAIMAERRENGKFFSVEEFVTRLKGKKVNKTHTRHLILSGCFDELYNIDFMPKRLDLIREYCKVYKEKFEDLDEFQDPAVFEDFFWFKRQRKLSGFGTFDYATYIDTLGFSFHDFMGPEEIQLQDSEQSIVVVAGILIEAIRRKTKKGEMGKLTIDSNNGIIDVVLWNDTWKDVKEAVEGNIGGGLAVRGKVMFDGYNKKNVVYSTDDTEVVIF